MALQVLRAVLLSAALFGAPVGSAHADSCGALIFPAEADPDLGVRWMMLNLGADTITGIFAVVSYEWLGDEGHGAWTSATIETTFDNGARQSLSFGYTPGPVGQFKVLYQNCR